MSDLDARLTALAHAHGVTTEFGDWRGGAAHASSAAIVAVLAALGVDASSPAAVDVALAAATDAPWRRMLPRYVVVRAGSAGRVEMHVPHGDSAAVSVQLEDGGRRELPQLMMWVDPRQVDGQLVGAATFEIPADLPLGYHQLQAVSGENSASAWLFVVPDHLDVPITHTEWGFMVQLYALRSRDSWGLGDFGDLADLASWSGRELGAGFVLVNPLHAAALGPPMEPSPYFPASRRFVNPVYLRVEDVPEVAALSLAALEDHAAPLQLRNETDAALDRDAVWAAKRAVLERAFTMRADVQRESRFSRFVADAGHALVDFATWSAIAHTHGASWRRWPRELQLHGPTAPGVLQFRHDHAQLIEFHMWLQWLCDEQLSRVQAAAREAGMAVGVVHDLAVGVSPDGADAWAWQHVIAPGVTLGAPADMYNQQGQRWNLPPWQPDALADTGFAPFRDLVRSSLRHGGGLRVDHIIGLFRQWWVPDGAIAAEGAYVRLDHEAMVGILLLEAHRAGALVIGEDLGTVEPWVREYLSARGVFGTSILWFEQDADTPRAPRAWRDLCLATVTTHDLPPTVGYLLGEHVELRARLGLLERSVDEERAADEVQRAAWIRALGELALLRGDVVAAVTSGPGTWEERLAPHLDDVVDALHAYLARTPAKLIGVYLPDVVGDRRPVNQPGTVDEYPNWRVPVADFSGRPVLLEELTRSSRASRLAQLIGDGSPSVSVTPNVPPTPIS